MARARLYKSTAERVAAHRAKNGTVKLTIDVSAEAMEGLNTYMRFKPYTKSQIVDKLIKNQLLRKR